MVSLQTASLGESRREDFWYARVDVAARGFSLLGGAAVAALSGHIGEAAGVAVLLIATATVMTWWAVVVGPGNATYRAALIIEGVFTLFLVALSTEAANPFVIYLAAPAFLAGLRAGLAMVFILLASELLTVFVIQAQRATIRTDFLETAGPWILTGWAFGLLGSWIRELRRSQRDLRSSPYSYTYRLLGQLRTITRGLPGGLDATAIAEDVVSAAIERTGATGVTVMLGSDDEPYRVLAGRGDVDHPRRLEEDAVVRRCLELRKPVQGQRSGSPIPDEAFRTGFPLVIGSRTIGVVVVDGPALMSDDTLRDLGELTNEAALRLESALIFNDVRSLATVEERQRLAREIHDGVAQEIGALGYLVDDLAREQCDLEHQAGMHTLRQELTRVVSDLRLSIYDLRSGVSSNVGLGAVLGEYVREIGRQSGMTVHLSLEESPQRLRADVETELLRIAQEAVNNARKHSQATNLWVTCRVEPPFAEIRVEDDGIGAARPLEGHYGLLSMRERADRIDAVLSVSDRSGGGTAVSVVLLPSINPVTPQSGETHVLQRSARR